MLSLGEMVDRTLPKCLMNTFSQVAATSAPNLMPRLDLQTLLEEAVQHHCILRKIGPK